jgi:hypothetical protein
VRGTSYETHNYILLSNLLLLHPPLVQILSSEPCSQTPSIYVLLMERLSNKLTIFWENVVGIQVYFMSDRSGQQIVILTTIWRWQELGRDWQSVNKDHADFIGEAQHQEYKGGRGLKAVSCCALAWFPDLEDLDAGVDINSARNY